jgi:2-oxoglutarate dehydrogenase E1 component
VRDRFEAILDDLRGGCHRLRYIGRPASASPAVGSNKVHVKEQEALVAEAMGVDAGGTPLLVTKSRPD